MRSSLFLAALFLVANFLRPQSGKQPDFSSYEKFNRNFFEGVRLYITGQHDQAILRFENCLQITDTVAAVSYYLAAAYAESGQTGLAVRHIDHALQLQPNNKWFHKLKIRIVSRKKSPPHSSQKGTSASLRSEQDVLSRIHTLRRHSTPEDAWPAIRQLALSFPYFPRVQLAAAQVAVELQKFDQAEQFLKNGMDFARPFPELYRKYIMLLKEIYLKTGQTRKWKELDQKLQNTGE